MSTCIKTLQKSRLHFTFSLLLGIGLLIAYDIYFVFKCQGHTSLFISFRYIMRMMLYLGHIISYVIWGHWVFRVFRTSYTLSCYAECSVCSPKWQAYKATTPDLHRPTPRSPASVLATGLRLLILAPLPLIRPFLPFLLWHGELWH